MQLILGIFVAKLLDPAVLITAAIFGAINRRNPQPYNLTSVVVTGVILAILSHVLLVYSDPTFKSSSRSQLSWFYVLNNLLLIPALAVDVWLFRLLMRKREKSS